MSKLIDQSMNQLEEIRSLQRLKYNKKIEQEQIEQKKLEEIQLQKERLENEKLGKIRAEELLSKEHQDYLDKRSKEENKGIKNSYTECLCSQDENEIPIFRSDSLNEIPMIHSDFLNESFVIIFSIFEGEQSYDFVQNSILNHFYHQVNNSNIDDLYTFYISIKEISSTYESIEMEIIFNTLSLIQIDCQFVEILNKSNKLEYIKIIFQEFIKIIDHVKPEFYST